MTDRSPSLPHILQTARKKLDITQREAARRTGISAPHYNDLEHGKRTPGPITIPRIAATLGIHEDSLYFLCGRVPPDLLANALTLAELGSVMNHLRMVVRPTQQEE